MNREIKFRVFCEKHSQWEYYTLGDLVCGSTTSSNEEGGMFRSETWNQYTGLKDKNGNEIYEGDVCKLNFHTVEIIFNNGCFGYYLISNHPDHFVGLGVNYNLEWVDNKSNVVEVLGNIYENPELLNNKL